MGVPGPLSPAGMTATAILAGRRIAEQPDCDAANPWSAYICDDLHLWARRLLVMRDSGEVYQEMNGMDIKPLGDRVVVKRQDAEATTKGGILLPDSAKDKPQRGKILAVGPGKLGKNGKHTALDVKVGDTVLFTSWAGDEIKTPSRGEVLLMRVDDIMAVVEG